MTAETDYRSAPGVSASRLKKMLDSPKHYRRNYSKDTTNRVFLRAQHAAILEPEAYDRDYALCQVRRSLRDKAFQSWIERNPHAVTRHEDGTIAEVRALTEGEIWTIAHVRDAVLAHPVASGLLAEGEGEVEIYWTDPETGLPCKGRLDWLNRSAGYVADLKGYGSSNPRIIGKRVEGIGAHIQAGHYVSGCEALWGWTPRYYIISAEQQPPWDVCVVELADVAKLRTPEGVEYTMPGALADGRTERAKLMQRVKECTESGEWPGRHEHDVVQLLPPPWRGEEDGADFDLEGDDE